MLKQSLPWVLSAITVYTMFLAGERHKYTWIVGLVNQGLWLVYILLIQAWGLLPMNIALWIVYTRNQIKWLAQRGNGEVGND